MKKTFVQAFNKFKNLLFNLKNKLTASRFGTACRKINEKRASNTSRFKATNACLLILFPIFITTMAEIIHMKSPSKFIVFLFTKPSIVIFNILLCALLYIAIMLIVKKGWIATFVLSVCYTTLSIVELFKFNTSGNHLILTDFKLSVNIDKITSFAYIKITPALVACVAIVLAYFVAVFIFNPVLKRRSVKRIATSALCFMTVAVTVATPAIATPVYSFFDIDTSSSDNVFRVNEKFDNNSFLAFLTQTTTEYLNRGVATPVNYSADSINMLLESADSPSQDDESVKPNVIMIMSEAFTDFRIFEELDFDREVYAPFDRIANEGKSGYTVVPTFGSYTVRTEFELLFGLPVRSLNDPNMPHKLLLDREQQTIPSYYSSLGYSTNYIHTFLRTFYSRDRVYANYGFDNMYFDDNLTVPTEYYKTYISDRTIWDQAEKIIEDSDGPAFIHCTTMQDHQPYDPETDDETELDYYIDVVGDMLNGLEEFINKLKNCGEPTVVFFTGDHYPCFKGENSAYELLEINADNCSELYKQHYFIWANYDIDYGKIPDEPFSVFYAPYIIMDAAGLPLNDFQTAMLDKMSELPTYSTCYDNSDYRDSELDMLTYDIVMGDKYTTSECKFRDFMSFTEISDVSVPKIENYGRKAFNHD